MVSSAAFSSVLRPLIVLLVFPCRVSNADLGGLELPTPNGCYAVGSKTVALRDQRRNRDLLVSMWYPARREKRETAPYMEGETAEAIAKEWKLKPEFARLIHSHAMLSVASAEGGPFPVVLLEHGSGTVPAAYTVLAEGLASSGFVVVATNHPPDSLIAVFADGHDVRFAPYWPVHADRRTQGEAIGKFAENVLLADVRFVLDQLEAMAKHDEFWHGQLDLSRVGIVGHSMGGTTAALATLEESRILVGVNLDGSTFPGMNADVRPINLRKPFLFVMTEEHASDPATRGREYIGRESDSYYVVVPRADHMSFSDARLVQARFGRDEKPESGAFERALLAALVTRSLVEEFLAKYLRGDGAPHLDLAVHVDKR
jgi:dienelactone hydrolase